MKIEEAFETYYSVERPKQDAPSFLDIADNWRCQVYRDFAAGWDAALEAANAKPTDEVKPKGFCI